MANRFPLVIDTSDGNKIKELPAGDNLDLTQTSIVSVQDITATGTINAAVINVAGSPLVAQTFAELSDTPTTFQGSESYFVKVNAAGNGLEFRSLSDLGTIEIDSVVVNTSLLPKINNDADIGTNDKRFRTVWAEAARTDLVSFDGTTVFDATTGKIPYAALIDYPTQVSEFANDVGYVTASGLADDLSTQLREGGNAQFDLKGSVFGDDSTMLVNALDSKIVGPIESLSAVITDLTATQAITTNLSTTLIQGRSSADLVIRSGATTADVVIGDEGQTTTRDVVLHNAKAKAINLGTGIGTGKLTSVTDLEFLAGNRIKVTNPTPFKMGPVSNTDKASIAPQAGDIIYNTDENEFQFYQNGEWITYNAGTFDGDITGSVFADDSTLLVDGVSGKIVGTIDTKGNQARFSAVVSQTSDLDAISPATYHGMIMHVHNEGAWYGAHAGAWYKIADVDSSLKGDLQGSIFADDSTLLVDAVAGIITGDVQNTEVVTTTVQGRAATDLYIYRGAAGTVTVGDASSGSLSVSDSGINITATNGIDINGAATGIVNIGTGATTGNVTIGKVGNTTTIDGTLSATLTGNVTGALTGDVTGDVIGSVFADDSTMLVDGLNNRLTGILTGNIESSSWDISSDSYLSIINQGDSGAGPIQISASGNLDLLAGAGYAITANRNIIANGGLTGNTTGYHTGDVTGSIFSDDSTLLVDAVNAQFVGTLVGNVIGDIEGDPIMTVSTPLANDGEVLNITTGSNRSGFVNITSDTLRHFGDDIDFQATDSFEAGTAGTTIFTYLGSTNTTTLTGLYSLTSDGITMNGGTDTIQATTTGAMNLTGSSINLFGSVVATGDITASAFKGTVVGDDSTVLVDAISGTLSGVIVTDAGTTPTDAADPGAEGEIRFDNDYIYIKTSAGWKRTALSGLV